MADDTRIEWCDSTFNPWTGCTKVSPGCEHCYAEGWSKRAGEKVGKWGPGAPRVRTTLANWRKPLAWNRDAAHFVECIDCGRRGDARTWLDDIKRTLPTAIGCCPDQRLRPARRRVFCASLADVFDNEVPALWRVELFALIGACENLDFLLLTKRIGNVRRLIEDTAHEARERGMEATAEWLDRWLTGNAPSNVWLGATVVNQEEADRDVPKLLATPAAVRFLSIEPMLGPVDLTPAYLPCPTSARYGGPAMDPSTGAYECCRKCDYTGISNEMGIDWVIVGGESGPHARPMHPAWVRSLRDQCVAAGVPLLFKQWGEWTDHNHAGIAESGPVMTPKGDVRDWMSQHVRFSDGRIAELHAHSWTGHATDLMFRVGKKAAGRLLDGRTWDQFPEVSHV